ncbi:MAG: hypothetical protein J5601_04730, partial [Elusimicrobiaceae bacterium]|nr:hypothetical protein [Elusimicrobiaceae bacterium]
MPNKDSFTFSDKLRKSKSVPLSKRLPSIVGGQNKQKRTLVQRAQRDLPFILVAALALLLLPFLSKTGSDDITGTGDLAWNSMADAPGFTETGYSDIQPAGSMQDPLDLILRPRSSSEESGVTMRTDARKSAYGRDGDEESSSSYSRYSRKTGTSTTPNYNDRKSYDEQYTTRITKAPATTKYGKKIRSAVRQSITRKATDINRALRISQVQGPRGASNVSHSLPIGQGPTRTPGTAFREGVRPIALQPMESRGGVGRGSDGLRAESDRSIREMNAGGPAKANLIAAQMKDVDGKPLGDTPGFGPGPGASVRPGAGGGPGNTNGYNVQKPWWWDMMQTRSQKMWDLLYYEPRKIWYSNMYNYASQLMNCLFTGNSKGDVSTMFGKGAADSDFMCVKNGKEIMVRYNKQKPTSTSKDKDGNKTEELVDSNWFLTCDKLGGESVEKKKDAKSFLEVRAECVGLDVVWDWLKDITKHTKYDSDCSYINGDPMEFTLDIERSNARGKHNTRREKKLAEKTVIALLAKVKEGKYKDKEIVVYAQQGNTLSKEGSDFAKDFNQNNQHCTLSRLVALVSRKTTGQIEHVLDIYNDNRRLWQGEVTAGRTICNSGDSEFKPATLDDIRNWTDLGKGKKIEDDSTPRYAECNIWETKPNRSKRKIDGIQCENDRERKIEIKQTTAFEATIVNTKDKHVFAVLVDQIDQDTDAIVTYIVDFGTGERGNDGSFGLKKCDNDGTCTFSFTANVASLGLSPDTYGKNIPTGYKENSDATQAKTARGSGIVFWITTDKNSKLKVKRGDKVGQTIHDVKIGNLIETSETFYYDLCRYRWCNDIGICDVPEKPSPKDFCVENGKAYLAHRISLDDQDVYIKVKELGPQSGITITDLPPCVILCHDPDGKVHICDKNGEPEDGEPICPLSKIPEEYRPNVPPCPSCCYYTTSDGKTNNYKSIKIDDKYYITDATPNACEKPKGKCTPAAWSMEGNDLIVYDIGMDPYKPECLKFTPGESAEPFKTCTGNGC